VSILSLNQLCKKIEVFLMSPRCLMVFEQSCKSKRTLRDYKMNLDYFLIFFVFMPLKSVFNPTIRITNPINIKRPPSGIFSPSCIHKFFEIKEIPRTIVPNPPIINRGSFSSNNISTIIEALESQ